MNIEKLIAQLRSARYAHEVSLEMLRAAADALEAMRAEANTCGSGAGCCAQAAENEANMQTCKGIIKGLTADRKRKDALLRECLTALEYHTDHTLDTMDKIKEELK